MIILAENTGLRPQQPDTAGQTGRRYVAQVCARPPTRPSPAHFFGGGVRVTKRVAVRAARTDDEAEALRVVASGLSVRAAAGVLGVSPGTVQARVARALRKLPDPDAALHRGRMDAELARVRDEAWRIVESPPHVVSAGKVTSERDAQAITAALNTVLKAMERQARLFGLDAPSRQTVQVVDNRALDEAIAEVQRQLDLTVEGSVSDGPAGEGDGGSGEDRGVCAVEAGVGSEAGGEAVPLVL